jgi:hypothetical protein
MNEFIESIKSLLGDNAIAGIITFILGLLGVGTAFWAKVKKVLAKMYDIAALLVNVTDLGKYTVDALEDNKVTKDEIRQIKEKWEEVRKQLDKLNIKFLAAKSKNGK